MCLAVPVRLIEVSGTSAKVDAGGNFVTVDVSLVPDAVEGNRVIIHAGFAIQKYSQAEAAETLDLFRQIAESTEDE